MEPTPVAAVATTSGRGSEGRPGNAAEQHGHGTTLDLLMLVFEHDFFYFDVTDENIPENSGTETAGVLSPKGSLVFQPGEWGELYVSGGLGFHSNDARGTVIEIDPATGEPAEPVDPIVSSRGAEVGIRTDLITELRSTVSLWWLEPGSRESRPKESPIFTSTRRSLGSFESRSASGSETAAAGKHPATSRSAFT